MANNLQWNSVRADFSDANAAMGNAQKGLSQAGTVFGQLRQSILDEEQRAVDNAHRQKVFDENVRQFGLQHALNEDKLAEAILHNRNTEGLTARGQDLSHRAAMANVGVQREGLRLRQAQFDRSLRNENARLANADARLAFEREKWNALQSEKAENKQTLASIADNLFASRKDLDEKIANTQTLLEQATDPTDVAKLNSTLGMLQQERNGMSATSLDSQYKINAARAGIHVDKTPFTSEAALEQDRLKAAVANKFKAEEKAVKNALEATKIIKDLNLTSGQQELAHKVLLKAKQLYPNVPDNVLANALAKTPTNNAWFDWDGKNAFGYDSLTDNTLQDFINGVDLDTNLFNQALAAESLKFMRSSQKK